MVDEEQYEENKKIKRKNKEIKKKRNIRGK